MIKFLKKLFGGNIKSMDTESNLSDEVWNLKCSICGHTYLVGKDATIVTMEDAFNSGNVILFTSGNTPIRKDLVASIADWPTDRLEAGQKNARQNIRIIRNALSKGHKRYWNCKTCNNENRPFKYPS